MPDDIEFLTKPALATGMLTRALNAGVPARWVAGDEVYGADPPARRAGGPAGSGTCWPSAATAASPPRPGRSAPTSSPPACPRRAWQRLSAGAGAKGAALLRLGLDRPPRPRTADADPADTGSAGGCWSAATATPVSWRSTAATPRRRCRCASWSASPAAAGPSRSRFQAGKGLAGLDEHQVRRWTSWRRWTLLAMLAHALLAVIAAHEHDRPARTGRADRADLQRDPPPVHRLRHRTRPRPGLPAEPGQHWRRRHQHRARTSHYQRQEAAHRWP